MQRYVLGVQVVSNNLLGCLEDISIYWRHSKAISARSYPLLDSIAMKSSKGWPRDVTGRPASCTGATRIHLSGILLNAVPHTNGG